MADINFEEEQQFQRYDQVKQKPFMIRLLLSIGIVSTDDAAKYVLFSIAVLAVILAFIIPSFIGEGSPILTPTDQVRALSAPGMNL